MSGCIADHGTRRPLAGRHRTPCPHRRIDDRHAARGRRGRGRLRLHAQGPPDRAHGHAVPGARAARSHRRAARPRVFRDADVAGRRASTAATSCASRGRVERFRDELQVELRAIAARRGEADPAAFLPVAYRDLDELDGFLEHLAARGPRPGATGRCSSALLGDGALRAAWRRAPCTRSGHHAYLGGLLEHTVAVGTLALETCQLHPRLDSDLLLTAALVHDLGKTREFTSAPRSG